MDEEMKSKEIITAPSWLGDQLTLFSATRNLHPKTMSGFT